MNKGLKVIRIIAFTICLILVIGVVYNVLAWKDTNGNYISSVKQLEATEDNLIDAVFVGSSHCYCGIYPSVLWDEYGISAFDMSISGQDRISGYYHLKNLLKTQNPKVVVVDVYGITYEKGEVLGNDYRNYLSMKPSINSVKMVNDYVSKEDRMDYYFRFPIIHTRYKELKENDFVQYTPNEFLRGEAYGGYIANVVLNEEAIKSQEVGVLTEKDKKWIDDLMILSDTEGFELEFVLIPFSVNKEQQAKINAAEKYIKEKGGKFTNYNNKLSEMGIDCGKDFIDAFHLNCYGAKKFTHYLAEDIITKYDLKDHRGDDRYYQWDKDSEAIKHYEAKELLPFIADNVAAMEGVAGLDDCITIINIDGSFLEQNVNYFEMTYPFGMDYDSFAEGGTWIYENGELTKVCNNTIGGQEYIRNIGQTDVLRVGYYGMYEPTNIMINKDWKPEGMGCFNVVVYDELLDELLFSKTY